MTDQKTIAIFGAGTGLGASVARRYGKAGFRVALVARNAQSLDQRVSELSAQGIDRVTPPFSRLSAAFVCFRLSI